ncbi:MAG TPA: tRNA uridine-5-carboxymethylaminomethyl(34) synthesis GTPase MnmE [Bacteroidales bacterium]|nr:tRNA uridine-5-carboxymethylaminomethyl(34) synthesis GTPase MnmE [Bacteroidales bacterium]
MIRKEDTICAPATSSGGAISVIRMSGPQSIDICEKILVPFDKNLNIREQNGFRIIHGEIRDGKEVVDDVLVSIYRAPHSYTGENSIEISCHGSPFIITGILELLIRNGALAAMPGEFTQRAFLNGKMDLSQAEAVADLVASGTKAAHRIAMSQMRGGFSAEISKLRSELLKFASLIELELDFGEEDVQFADRKELNSIVLKVKELADKLANSFRLGNVIKNGIPVAIVGKPNSGKSTLLNALLNEERAIVSEIPGTTRDIIEDSIVINGLEYKFIDTAGLRETSDIIEGLGIRKTNEKIMEASVIILVDEISESPDIINQRADSIRNKITGFDKKLIVLINKIDLGDQSEMDNLKRTVYLDIDDSLLFISAKNLTGLDKLRSKLGKILEKERFSQEDVIITNIRHFQSLKNVSESLERVIAGFAENLPGDLLATDIRQAIHYLGEITGEITTDEILANIFKNFCIGK